MLENRNPKSKTSRLISSPSPDAGHEVAKRFSFERWYFDAISDDGREVLVLSFYDNYPFSPRYFDRRIGRGDDRMIRHPAVTFLYSVEGKIVMEAVNEWGVDHFVTSGSDANCSIGDSSFRVEKAGYGSGYIVRIDMITARRRRIQADLEWLSVESDSSGVSQSSESEVVVWNPVIPRSDVSGRIVRTGMRGRTRSIFHFRGTGYHDHIQNSQPFERSVDLRCWGRAHFSDITAMFQNVSYCDDVGNSAHIALVNRDGISTIPAKFIKHDTGSDGNLPSAYFNAEDGLSISVRAKMLLQRGFLEQRMLADVELSATDGSKRMSEGLIEHWHPSGLRNPLFRWITDLKIGRNGGSPYF